MIDILRIRITATEFAGLELTRDPRTGTLTYSVAALTSILESQQIDPAGIIGDEDQVAEILIRWYIANRNFCGDVNPGIEQVIAEAMAEDEFGAERAQRGSILPQ
jgi:hypothetical protein